MSLTNDPLVSCICLTQNELAILKKSIKCFQDQTYSNKELIVAFTTDNEDTATFLHQLNDPRVKPLELPSMTKFMLGEKRNFAIEHSNGFYFCVWDDDDWYGNKRIEFHIKSLKDTNYKSSVLSSLILYDVEKNEAYLSATRWAWEQTLLCERSIFDNPELRYSKLERGEDSVFIYNLKKNDLLVTAFNPSLYIYILHGKNTWGREHWDKNLFQWATKLTDEQSINIQKILEGRWTNQEASDLLEKLIS